MGRGELWWASLPEPTGSEPGYRRPVLVVQSDRFTSSRIATVILIAVTSNLQLAAAPGNVLLSSRDTGLPRDSVANISQVLTVNKSRLTERIGRIPHKLLQRIEEGLRLVLSL